MTLLLAASSGTLLVAGLCALLLSRLRPVPRLADALEVLEGRRDPGMAEEGIGRFGAWLRRGGFVVTEETRRRLRLVGTSVDRHLASKLLGAAAGLTIPAVAGGALAWFAATGIAIPVVLAVACAVFGFFLPDLLLRRRDRTVTEDTTEALLTFFDLVTLERLANRSGGQALQAAAAMSSAPVFRAIAQALERARLEQRAPYAELQRVGRDLGLPALVDVADVMRLDESGASLEGALRARVKELRDAHLLAMKLHASEVSERMGVLMVVPTLEFGLLFLVPPLLRLMVG